MASYHLSVKPLSRAKGRSATGSAAYRSATRIRDERTGEVWDFRRKRGVLHRQIVLPPEAPAWAGFRERLWNAAESADNRKNSTVAREFEIALPAELGPHDRQALAVKFARELVARHGFAADVVLHAPHRMGNGLNFHAHILCSTRRLKPVGFGEKTRELDDLKKGPAEVQRWRARWAEVQNQALAERGHVARVDHRSLKAQGAEREPTRHRGPAITAMERRGVQTEVGERLRDEQRREMETGLKRAAEISGREAARSVPRVSSDIPTAVQARDALKENAAEQVREMAKQVQERHRIARDKEAERIRAMAVEAWKQYRAAWDKEAERVREMAVAAWERYRVAREKPLKAGRHRSGGLELEAVPTAERTRSRDGPDFG